MKKIIKFLKFVLNSSCCEIQFFTQIFKTQRVKTRNEFESPPPVLPIRVYATSVY